MNSRKFLAAVLIAGSLIAAGLYYKYRVAPSIAFPQLELTDLEGKPVSLADVTGNNLFVSFFATWCGPCMQEVPLLQNVRTQLAGNNFVFVLVSDESLPTLKRFAEKSGTTIRILRSKHKLKHLGIHSVPTNYLLNKQGKIVLEQVGTLEGEAVSIAAKFIKVTR
jgi:peroxiredoxin